MEYHEIGERFEYNGVVLEVVKRNNCKDCFFRDRLECGVMSPMRCSPDMRDDDTSIIYKLVEKCKTEDMEQKTEINVEGTGETFATLTTKHHSNEDMYRSLLDKLFETYKAKNSDYGNAFAEMFDELGFDYAYGKLREKMNRIKVLRKQPNMVENEGLEDALLDTAGYAILTLVELKKRKINGTTNQNMKVLRNNMRCDKFECDMEKDIPYAFKEAIEDNKRMKDAILLFNQYLMGNFDIQIMLDCNDNIINKLINDVAIGIKKLKIYYDGKSK